MEREVSGTPTPVGVPLHSLVLLFFLHSLISSGALIFATPASNNFVTHPGIKSTNNAAEKAIRFCVIDRMVTQGIGDIKGGNWCERIWSTMATCVQRNINAFNFIATAVACCFNAASAPSLLE